MHQCVNKFNQYFILPGSSVDQFPSPITVRAFPRSMVTLGLKNCGLEDISGVSLKQAQKFYYFIEYCKICRNCSYRLRLERPTVERPTEIDLIMLWLTLISIFYWKTLFLVPDPLLFILIPWRNLASWSQAIAAYIHVARQILSYL